MVNTSAVASDPATKPQSHMENQALSDSPGDDYMDKSINKTPQGAEKKLQTMILRSTGSKEMGTKPPVFAKFQNAVKNMVKSDDFNPPKRRDR